MTGRARQGKESGDLRLGDALLGLPCLQRQRAVTAGAVRGAQAGEPACPVCAAEAPELSYELSYEPGDRAVIERVQDMFPGWRPEDGLCGPCLERFGEVGGEG